MSKKENKRSKSVVDEAMLRAFAKGQLDETTENKIVALLEQKPELQAKVAAISVDPVIEKMRAHSQVVATRSLSSQFAKDKDNVEADRTPPVDIPRELEALSEFRVIRELGRGGMGVVYLAENKWMGNRKEVLKVLNERLIGNEDAKSRFQKEIEITAKLEHPAIVKSHSVRPLNNVIVFSMEYVEGKNLFDFINENGKLPVHVACGIATDICAGLQHAMNRGAIHRDIKPSNIMLYKGGDDGKIHAKILDFGLARVANTDQSRGLTQDGTLLGTLEYIAPEQSLDANKADIRADIYSLGCTLYHMLVGHPPFSGSTGELILAHSQKVPPAVNLVQPTVPVELADVVARLLSKQPNRRYQSPDEVAMALQPFLKSSAKNSLSPVPESIPTAPETHGPETEFRRDTSVDMNSPKMGVIPLAKPIEPSVSDQTEPENPAIKVTAGTIGTTTRPRRRKNSILTRFPGSKWIFVACGILALTALGTAAWSILKVKTAKGTIVFENLPNDADVLVDGTRVELTWNEGQAKLVASAGERTIEVMHDGALITGRTVIVTRNTETPISISWEANEDVAKGSDDESQRNSSAEGADLARGNLDSPEGSNVRTDWTDIFANGKLATNVRNTINDGNKPFVVDGDLLKGHPQGGDRLLFVPINLENFVARLEYRIDGAAEGALIFRSPSSTHRRPEGYSIGLNSSGNWIYDVNRIFQFTYKSGNATKELHRAVGAEVIADDWHVLEVECFGEQITAVLDGKVVHRTHLDLFSMGWLGLHSRAPGLEVRQFSYREIEQATLSKTSNGLSNDDGRTSRLADIVVGSSGSWRVEGEQLVHVSDGRGFYNIRFGDLTWTDYEFSHRFMLSHRSNSMSTLFRCPGDSDSWVGFGLDWSGSVAGLGHDRQNPVTSAPHPPLEANRWYESKVVVKGSHIECYLDGELMLESDDCPHDAGRVGISFWRSHPQMRTVFQDITVKSLDGSVLWSGIPELESN